MINHKFDSSNRASYCLSVCLNDVNHDDEWMMNEWMNEWMNDEWMNDEWMMNEWMMMNEYIVE